MSLVTVELPTCPVCGTATLALVDADAFDAFATGGLLVQEAFPDWSPDDRELLVTGTHPACWDTLTERDHKAGDTP